MRSAIVRRAQPCLGTLVSFDVVPVDGVDVDAACAAAFAVFARVHGAMSPQDPSSDVARFNAAGAGAAIDCDAWTVDVLRRAERLRLATGGLFDVALGSARGPAYRITTTTRIDKIAVGAHIDLGGIAKGYAVDRAVLALRARGIAAGLVNAGGDLRAFGACAWPVRVRGLDGSAAMEVALERGAIATSAYRAGRSPFHRDALIRPALRQVHAIDRTITVAAPRCVVADALTKLIALTGDTRHPLLDRTGACAWLH
jgi:FAD:protein FMN transferase